LPLIPIEMLSMEYGQKCKGRGKSETGGGRKV